MHLHVSSTREGSRGRGKISGEWRMRDDEIGRCSFQSKRKSGKPRFSPAQSEGKDIVPVDIHSIVTVVCCVFRQRLGRSIGIVYKRWQFDCAKHSKHQLDASRCVQLLYPRSDLHIIGAEGRGSAEVEDGVVPDLSYVDWAEPVGPDTETDVSVDVIGSVSWNSE